MNECLGLNIQIIPRFNDDGRLRIQTNLNGRGFYEGKRIYGLVELFYATVKPENSVESKRALIKRIRAEAEGLLAILTVQEAALQGAVPTVTDDDSIPF